MMQKPPFSARLLAVMLPLCLTEHARAGELVQLETVEVKASTPTQDDTVKRKELLEKQAHNLNEIFARDAEISVGGGGNAIAQKMYIRGMEESLLNLSIDGAQINNKIYHHQTALILDPQLIRQVEVEKGTPSASAGPGALGGAIRYETVSARDLLREGQTLGGSVTGSAFSNDGWRSSASVYGLLGDKVDTLVSASSMDTHDYKDGRGQTVADSGTRQRNYLAKIGMQLTETQRVTAAFQRSSDEGVRNTRANMVGFAHPVVPNDPIPQSLSRDTATVNYQGRQLGWIDGVDSTVYRSEVESERTSKKGRSWGETLTTSGADLTLKKAVGEHLVKVGLNWREEKSAANRIANPFGLTGTGKEDMQVKGGFVESQLNIGNVTVTGGLRFDDYRYTDNHQQTFTSHGFSPSAGISWQATEALQLRTGYAEALRGVGLKEAFMLDIAQWKNNPSINPEKAHNIEAGFTYRTGGLELNGTLYRQVIDNFITSFGASAATPCANGMRSCRGNLGQATINGYELATRYRIGNLTLGLSVADSRPELEGRKFNDQDLGLGTRTGRTWVGTVAYALPSRAIELGWLGRFVESMDYLPPYSTASGTKAGYGINDVFVSWMPLKKDTLRLNLTVKNLFNQHYYDQATYGYQGVQGKVLGYPEPGRDVRLEANWKF